MKPVHVAALAVVWIATAVGAVLLKEPNIYWGAAIATLACLDMLCGNEGKR